MSDAGTLASWIRQEQEILWSQLDNAIRSAIDGVWSMECDSTTDRIVEAANLVGPTHRDSAPWTLLAGGVYEAVLSASGIPVVMPDDAEWKLDEVRMSGRCGTVAENRRRYADTVARIAGRRRP